MEITTKEQLRNILNLERTFYISQLGNPVVDYLFARPGRKIYNYIYHLRKMEYYNSKGFVGRLGYYFHYFFKTRLSYKLGYQIPCGTCGKGLKIYHYGGGGDSNQRHSSNWRVL